MESLERLLAEKKKKLKELSAKFARDELKEEEYLKQVKTLSEEIEKIKSSLEKSVKEKLKSVMGMRVFSGDKLVGRVSEISGDMEGLFLRVETSREEPIKVRVELKCPNCGAIVAEDAKFCVRCGTRVR